MVLEDARGKCTKHANLQSEWSFVSVPSIIKQVERALARYACKCNIYSTLEWNGSMWFIKEKNKIKRMDRCAPSFLMEAINIIKIYTQRI